MNCSAEEKYTTRDGRCCDKCPAGQYVRAECDDTKKTECAVCGRGLFTATPNYLFKCRECKSCTPHKKQRKVMDCTAEEDTECECVPGFICSNTQCDHCQKVKVCGPGQGVKIKATRTHDTVCGVCEEGTFSNVTDYLSPCQTHTRCEDLGRLVETPGTRTADAVCGDFKSYCHWIIPAGLWSGLVLTALVLFGLICWRMKRKSSRAASPSVPVKFIDMTPAEAPSPFELPLPAIEQNDHCTESCLEEGCKLPLFTPDDDHVASICTEDSVSSSLPITPLKASISFQHNGNAGYGVGHFLRAPSEPQEDEWCGTEVS